MSAKAMSANKQYICKANIKESWKVIGPASGAKRKISRDYIDGLEKTKIELLPLLSLTKEVTVCM